MITVDIMMGIIGSGKSTLAKQIAKENNAIILSSDAVRKVLVDSGKIPLVYNIQTNKVVFAELHRQFEEALQNKQNVIIDGINSIKRETLFAITNRYDCYVKGRLLWTDKKICLERVREREKNDPFIHKIDNPEKVASNEIELFKKNYPTLDEGFDELIIYRNNVVESVQRRVNKI